MANAGNKQGGGSFKAPPAAAAAADQELDPKYEWQETATSFILRIHLSGFRKQDFRVQVDGAGRLTVRGQRADAAASPSHSRFSKVFQLPSTSNLDDIAGRFESGVLTLTVPKRLPVPAKQQQQQKAAKDEDATTKKPAAEQQHKAAAAAPPPPPPAVRKEDEGKPKPDAAAAAPTPAPATATDTEKQAATPKPAPSPQPQAADAERKAADTKKESLAERVKQRAEEERAKAAAAAEAAERQSKGFKERVAEELQGLAGSEWAEGLVETVKKNKEVIAAAVAAFSLGVLVSSKLFCRSSRN